MERLFLLLLVSLLAGCAAGPKPPAGKPVVHRQMFGLTKTTPQDDVLFRALGLVGTPYRWGGNSPNGGFDCSGLIVYVYRDVLGVRLPRTSRQMAAMGRPTVSRGSLRSGDLLFFATEGRGRVSHVGIYVGDGRFVHAPHTGSTVRLSKLDSPYWRSHYLLAKRVLEDGALASAATR